MLCATTHWFKMYLFSQVLLNSPFLVCILSYCFISFHYFTITIFSRYASQVNVGRDGSDLFALCISCCVSALNGSRNKEVVDQAKGGGVNQMWYESDAAMIGIQWPGNTRPLSPSLSLSFSPCVSLSEQGYQQRLSGWDNGWLIHVGSEGFWHQAYLGLSTYLT